MLMDCPNNTFATQNAQCQYICGILLVYFIAHHKHTPSASNSTQEWHLLGAFHTTKWMTSWTILLISSPVILLVIHCHLLPKWYNLIHLQPFVFPTCSAIHRLFSHLLSHVLTTALRLLLLRKATSASLMCITVPKKTTLTFPSWWSL
jgi:hypothetical protein